MQAVANVMSLKKIAGVVLAVRYRRAAKRDERNGFPLTAAFEWRKAAELSAPIIPLAKNCWREWERIMHLPRRLADPIDNRACSPDGDAPIELLANAQA